MSMSKKMFCIFLSLLSFLFFSDNVYAIASSLSIDNDTEEFVYDYQAGYVGLKRIWVECKNIDTGENVTLTLYNNGTSFTKERVKGRKDTNSFKNGTYECNPYVQTSWQEKNREPHSVNLEYVIKFKKKNYNPEKDPNAGGGMNSPLLESKTCEMITLEEECGIYASCQWTSGNTCITKYVAADPCNDENILTVMRFFGYLLLIAKVAIPLIIIIIGTFDLYKSVVDKDEKSFSKQMQILLWRIVGGVFVFFIPTIVYAIFGLSSNLGIINDQKYDNCMECLFKPTECDIPEENG